ncbi:MAG: HNH endonuclease signature motif containing protein [Acidobacteriota bacterium]|nr:HNH endonuclease signature motif containing protein [Acidobacteriota bacterium]
MDRAGSRFYASIRGRRWDRVRRRELKRTGYRCERCGKAGRLEVHHKRPLHRGGDAYAADNLAVLCRRCHIEAHRRPLSDEAQRWADLLRGVFLAGKI